MVFRAFARRLGFAVLTLLAILFLSGLGLSMARGAPFRTALVDAETNAAHSLWMVSHGDLGSSTSRAREPVPAGPVVGVTVMRSLVLLGTALGIGGDLGILVGGAAARRPGSPEADRAAEYIAAQFAAAGLQPAGQRGTYFQEVVREYLEYTAPPELALIVAVSIPWRERREVARNVLGLLPGGEGTGGAASEGGGGSLQMDDQRVVLMAPYDAPGTAPDGTLYTSAQDSASAVATLLELARSWQEADYRPKRSFLFAAYVSQGVDPNQSYRRIPEPEDFLRARQGFSSYKVWAVIELWGLGAPDGKALLVDTASPRLGNLFVNAARRLRVRAERLESAVDLKAI